ncbi:hypothetical protein MTR62_10940 [Novosphingobium sp. 1949]|uniref:Uncharacterized protein n=1 Tax=Novosphingobium organovorum TaxID=2930092 RepID=A0ABT0BDY3_9SPHN|nr:hypothetical protein [Novosphingobium organovorum]MCJ2183204.1 hypothetical protein [Novosphingobium organovorum]
MGFDPGFARAATPLLAATLAATGSATPLAAPASPTHTPVSAPMNTAAASPQTLAAFEAMLSSHDSATLALEQWCALHHLGTPATITAHSRPMQAVPAQGRPASHLKPAAHESIALRHVELRCGATVLSVAWNWYVPERLTSAMNATLATTDRPFGKVVAPLGFHRVALARVAGPAGTCPRDTISTHQAMLVLPDGRPLSYLVECYTPANLHPAAR